MLLLVRALQRDERLATPTILVLVDRLDLEEQLYGTFAAHSSVVLATPVRAADAAPAHDYLWRRRALNDPEVSGG